MVQKNIVVTKYKDSDQGLKSYIGNKSVRNTDVVTWYSTGFGHVPHTEQYPVMSREVVTVRLSPHNFFTECPALYIPGATTQGKYPNTT